MQRGVNQNTCPIALLCSYSLVVAKMPGKPNDYGAIWVWNDRFSANMSFLRRNTQKFKDLPIRVYRSSLRTPWGASARGMAPSERKRLAEQALTRSL